MRNRKPTVSAPKSAVAGRKKASRRSTKASMPAIDVSPAAQGQLPRKILESSPPSPDGNQ